MRLKLFILLLFPLLLSPLTAIAFTANVMAPLLVEDRAKFRAQLAVAKHIGVDGVSVDVWWGLVEQADDQQFNWQYYDAIFADIRGAGLNIIPIMAFHQCGGNVGDNCDIPLPAWIWQHYTKAGVSATDLQYQSEFANRSVETVSLWADTWVLPQYREFMLAFAQRYAKLAPQISEINISMGPAGELRYPSYNSHDGNRTGYPSRGGFQAYSALAVADFRRAMQQQYQQITQLNQAWQSNLSSFNQITPPADGAVFIHSGAQFTSAYGRDFIRWYQQALLQHGQQMLDAAQAAFSGKLATIELGFKIPGIHCKMAANDHTRRSAELAAGLIASDTPYLSSNGFGYSSIVALAARNTTASRAVVLHFTALEMDDKPTAESQSMAKSLVSWLGAEATRQQVIIKGENALSAEVTHDHGWNNITGAFRAGHYSGLTVLRLAQVTDGGIGQQRYQQLITELKAAAKTAAAQ